MIRTPIAIRLSNIAADAQAWSEQATDLEEARYFLRYTAERIALLDCKVAALEMLRERGKPQVVAIDGGAA